MKATYNWDITHISAKKVFTDKHNNVRNNVIKSVVLCFFGKLDERVEKDSFVINFDLVNLTDFISVEELTKEQVLSWALNKIPAKEKERIEKSIMKKLGDLEDDSNEIKIIFNE